MKLLIFCLIPTIVHSIGDYNGYFFQDNLLQGSCALVPPHSMTFYYLERFGPENGYATFNAGIPIPNYVN